MKLAAWAKVYRTKFEVEQGVESTPLFILVKSGTFHLEMRGESCVVGPGEAVIFNPNEKYRRYVKEPVTIYLFRFHTKKELNHQLKITFKDHNRINSTLKFLDILDNKLFHDDFSHRQSLFNDIMTQYILENEPENSYIPDSDPMIAKAKLIFEQYLHEKSPLIETAKKLGISYVHFIRRFKQSTGITPLTYLTKLRLDRAKTFLTGTNMAIKDIAPKCGFENEYYFSNVFKKYTGMTPTSFRKQITAV